VSQAPVDDDLRRRIQVFYDRWTEPFVARYGSTLQAGLLLPGPGGPEDPALSNRLLTERAGLQVGERVLDAGCGVGGPALVMAESVAGLSVTGVTLSATQARLARATFAASQAHEHLGVLVADYHCLPYPAAAFDVAVLFETIGYSPDLGALARELARVVCPGGRVYVKDVFRPELLTPAQAADVEEFDDLWALARTPSISEIVAALSTAGFLEVVGAELDDVGEDRFRGAMVDLDQVAGVRLNELGTHFLRRFVDFPLLFGEVRAHRS
jgi:SAM-dependent methyltransferase